MATPWIVEVAFANVPNAPDTDLVWTDLTSRVRGVETSRGASREHDLNQPGTATVVLSNADRALDPTNLDGPYVDGDGTQVLPMKRVRIRLDDGVSLDEPVFEGFAEGWGQGYAGNRDAVAILTLTDAFLPLSKTDLPSGPFEIDISAVSPKYWWRLGEPGGSDTVYDEIVGEVGTATGDGEFGQAGLVAYDSDTAYKQPPGPTTDNIYAAGAAVFPASSATRLAFLEAAYGSQQSVTTPDHANLDGGTAIDVRARISIPLGSTTTQIKLAGKRYQGGTTLTDDGWYFELNRSGAGFYPRVQLVGNANTGTGQSVWAFSYPRAGNNTGATSVIATTPGEVRWFAFTAAPSGTTGIWNVNFYTSTSATPPADVTTWTQVGVTQSCDLNAGAFLSTAFLANGHPMAIAAQGMPTAGYPGGAFDAYDYYEYQQRSSVNGTLVADVDFTDSGQGWTVGDDTGDTGTDSTGKVFTIRGTTPQIVGATAPFSAEVIVQFVEDNLGVARTILQQGTTGGTPNYWKLSMTSTGFPRFDIVAGANTGQVTSSVSIDDNQEIHHVAITYSALGVMKIYVDGTDTTASGDTQLATMATAGISIGAPFPTVSGASWSGTIDEVLIFDRELTASEVAAHFEASTTPWAGDTSGQRIEKILDAVAWPADRRNIDTGDSVLQSSGFSGSALDVMQNITLSELIGSLFVARNGDIRFISRGNQFGLTPVAAFSDDHGTDSPLAALAPDYGVWLLRNSVSITRDGGKTQRAQDLTSIARYLPQSYSLTNLVHDSDELSLAVAASLVEQYGAPKLRIAKLTIIPSRDPALVPIVAALELEDWVDVTWTPQGSGDPVTVTCIVEKIEHRVGAGGYEWTVTLDLSPAPVDITPVGVISGDSPAPPGQPINLNSLENRIGQLESDVSDLEADVADLVADLAAVAADVAALQTATADSGWIALTLSGSWANYGSPFPTAAYRKVGSVVYLKGLVRNGTPGTTIGTLPVGYRPSEQHLFLGADALQFGSMVGGQATAGPTPNLTATVSSHQHGLQNHTHSNGTLQPQIPNTGNRIDVTTAGAIVHNADGSNAYISLSGISFLV